MSRVRVRVDGVMILTGVALVGGVWLYSKRGFIGDMLNKVNPTHENNVVNRTAEKYAIKGERNGYTYDTHLFAAFDLLNPWNEDKSYAEKVWGINQ